MIRPRHASTRPKKTVPIPEVQILGSLIGSGLSDTGLADATNLLFSTQQAFTSLDWILGGSTAADIGATAPDSTATASTLTETSATSTHYAAQGLYTAASPASYTLAISVKPGLRSRTTLYIYDTLNVANFARSTFDLAGVAIGVAASHGGTFSAESSAITSQSNSFLRCTLTATTSGSGSYVVVVYADSGAGTAAESITYAGNVSAAALSLWGAGVWAGAAGTYVPLNANAGAAASTVQQVFSPNGGTTAYWGTQTNNAWVGFDATIPVILTKWRFAARPGSATTQTYPYAPDYAAGFAGAKLQTDVADSTFASPTTVDTVPALPAGPYYPRYWLSERPIASGTAARYARLLPPAPSFGGVSALQVFAKAAPLAPAMPVQPVISPMGGRFPSLSPIVTITSDTPGASIYYTTDGTTPSPSTSRKYTGPIILSIGSGSTITVKAIAHLITLSTPTSLVTISPPFCGYGFKPNDNWYDDKGNLIEGHAGSSEWDPNTSAYYWIGQLQNINTIARPGHVGEPNGWPGTFLYKGIPLDPKDPDGLLNWKNMGSILPQIAPSTFIGGRFHWKYNALNNNYVLWHQPQKDDGTSTLYVASTSGSDITTGWTWNLTPIVTNIFYDYDLFTDSDGVSVYACWRDGISFDMKVQQLNTSYTGFTGSALIIPYTAGAREGNCLFKYPYVDGGTYFIITSTSIPYDSTIEGDLRYIFGTGAPGTTPLTAVWSSLNGAYAWATDPIGTNYNGQPGHVVMARGVIQPFIQLDYWHGGDGVQNYQSRYVWAPIVVTGSSMVIQQPSSWDPSQLATGYTLQTLTLSGSVFAVGNAQGTVIGTVIGTTASSTLTLTDSHSGAVQLVGGVIQVGATPPGTSGTFTIQLTETIFPGANSPNVTTLTITENAAGGSLSGSVATFSTAQSINLTTLGTTDWAAFGYTTNAASIVRKNAGGSLISTLTNVGSGTPANFNNVAGVPTWLSTWSDGTAPNGSVSNEGYTVFVAQPSGNGLSFTVPAGTSVQTLRVYVELSFSSSNTTQGKLTATLSDGSAAPYVDTTLTLVNSSVGLVGAYTITYAAASNGQTLTVLWANNTSLGSQNVQIYAVTLS